MTRRRKRWLIAAASIPLAWLGTETALRLTPIPEKLRNPPRTSTEFVDRHGHSLRTLLVDDERYARNVTLDRLSPHLVAATLAAEDKRFHKHAGIDWLALARALREALQIGHLGSGASTITQQLVKISDPSPRTMAAKSREMWLAAALERRWSKTRILEAYFNRLDYGNLQSGAAAASRFYFAKPPADLSPAEAAMLAGLPRAPGRLDPHRHPNAARARQHWVLSRMEAADFLTEAEAARARQERLHFSPRLRDFEAPHFVDLLLQRQGMVGKGGEVRTTLDRDLNRVTSTILDGQLRRIEDQNARSAFAVVLENATGAVLALASSGDYFDGASGQVNGAWRPRSPGSALKPFTFLLALQKGAHPGTVVPDVPTDFATPTGLYRPNNYNHRFHGPVTLRFALANSLNVASIRALRLAGGPEVLHHAMHDLGFTTLGHGAEHYGLGITLGNAEVRLLELANAYATLARLGEYQPYRLLHAPEAADTTGRRLFDPLQCYLLADMLADNAARTASFGLRSWLRFDFPVACKTGTSSDYRDNWTVGYTPEFTVAVWVGNFDGSPMRGITGVTGAAPAMHEIFEHLHRQHGTSWYVRPEGVTRQWIDPLTGYAVDASRPGALQELATRPIERRDDLYDAHGRVVLPPVYAEWARSGENALGDRIVVGSEAPALRITQPRAEAVYFLDPDLPSVSQQIRLRAESAGKVRWESTTLQVDETDAGTNVRLREGVHLLQATDLATGETASTRIHVRPW